MYNKRPSPIFVPHRLPSRGLTAWSLLFTFWLSLVLLTACGDSEPTPMPTATQAVEVTATPTVQTVRVAPRTPTPTAPPTGLAARSTPVDPADSLPLFAAHTERVRMALAQPLPILTLTNTVTNPLTADQLLAQDLAIADPRFQEHLHAQQDGAPLRNEIFGIYAVHADDITTATETCRQVACYRVEMYNYALNLEYLITSSDGLRIMNVRFQGQPVLDSAAVVDWHVSYSTRDGFGYSDAIGCPTFSQAAVVALCWRLTPMARWCAGIRIPPGMMRATWAIYSLTSRAMSIPSLRLM